MERLIKIIEELPLRERSYTDQNGQQKVFVTKGYVVTDGVNKFCAEAVGDLARALEKQSPRLLETYLLSYELSCREWLDQQQQRRFENGVRILKISKF